MIDLNQIKKIHFIGIGGIGISAAAGIMQEGFSVSGSDASEGEMVAALRAGGISVQVPHDAAAVQADADLVVYSAAVPEDNVERTRARELGIPELSYPNLLGLLMAGKYGIGVSGTDGKTTTTAMLAKILIDADLDPTVVLGSKAGFLNGNWRAGRSEYFVFESDEYRQAFDNYDPRIAVMTYIGADHLDYFGDSAKYLDAFKKYLSKLPEDGCAVINIDDARSVEASKDCRAGLLTYSIDHPADYSVKNIRVIDGRQEFTVMENGSAAATITLGLTGKYNIYNALAAIAAARRLGIGWEVIAKSLDGFGGVWRRFERLGRCGRAEVIADYAHTPPAIRQIIAAMKEFYPGKKILYVFQPHQYARTKNLFSEFVSIFAAAEKVVMSDIFYVAGRENPADFDVSSEKLTQAVGATGVEVVYGGNLTETEKLVRRLSAEYDVVLMLGAGDIYEAAKSLVE